MSTLAVYLRSGYLPAEELLELAPVVEALGFDGMSVPEHSLLPDYTDRTYPYAADGQPPFDVHAVFPDPLVVIGALAAVTSRLRFVTGVYLLPLRHPIHVAKAVATAANISGGRVSFGVGVGWLRDEFDSIGLTFSQRGQLTSESIAAIRALWEPGPAEFRGRHYSFGPLFLEPRPLLPIPILVGGVSDAAIARAVSLGDGLILPHLDVDEAAQVLGRLQAALSQTGRDPAGFEVHALADDVPGRTEMGLVALGVDAVYVQGWPNPARHKTTVPQKIAALEEYADKYLGQLRERSPRAAAGG